MSDIERPFPRKGPRGFHPPPTPASKTNARTPHSPAGKTCIAVHEKGWEVFVTRFMEFWREIIDIQTMLKR